MALFITLEMRSDLDVVAMELVALVMASLVILVMASIELVVLVVAVLVILVIMTAVLVMEADTMAETGLVILEIAVDSKDLVVTAIMGSLGSETRKTVKKESSPNRRLLDNMTS